MPVNINKNDPKKTTNSVYLFVTPTRHMFFLFLFFSCLWCFLLKHFFFFSDKRCVVCCVDTLSEKKVPCQFRTTLDQIVVLLLLIRLFLMIYHHFSRFSCYSRNWSTQTISGQISGTELTKWCNIQNTEEKLFPFIIYARLWV